jgi:hypothetical protein
MEMEGTSFPLGLYQRVSAAIERGMRGAKQVRKAVWVSPIPPGLEQCMVLRTAAGWALVGSIVRRSGEGIATVNYRIRTDRLEDQGRFFGASDEWKEKDSGDGGQRLPLVPERAREPETERLRRRRPSGSPVTNTLPIRWARAETGVIVKVIAAWVKFPSLKVSPLEQSYERVEKRRYLYRSGGGFESEIEVDEFGLVKRYGSYWFSL